MLGGEARKVQRDGKVHSDRQDMVVRVAALVPVGHEEFVEDSDHSGIKARSASKARKVRSDQDRKVRQGRRGLLARRVRKAHRVRSARLVTVPWSSRTSCCS